MIRHDDVEGVCTRGGGVLLIGTDDAVERLVPTHEIAFQVMQGTDVRVNDFNRGPLLRTLDRVFDRLEDQVREKELNVGLLRVPVPSYDRRAMREALVNAVVHRDYTLLGPVRVLFDDAGLTMSNPGGFVEGVTLDNLLSVEPKPRNPRLADALKRVGLAERTGRGVDLIYERSRCFPCITATRSTECSSPRPRRSST